MRTCGHTKRCIANAVQAIADNNAWTIARNDAHDVTHMPTEDVATALIWLAEGNTSCVNDGEDCTPVYNW